MSQLFSQGGHIQYKGTLKGLFDKLANNAGTYWTVQPEKKSVLFYVEMYSNISAPAHKIPAIKKIVGSQGYLVKKSKHKYQIYTTPDKLAQIYQLLSEN